MRNIEIHFDVHLGLGFISPDELPFEKFSVIPVIVHDVYAAEISRMQHNPEVGINEHLARYQDAGNLIGSNPVVVAHSKLPHAKPLKNVQRRAMLGVRITAAGLQEGFLAS
jgi:hypothetical protein